MFSRRELNVEIYELACVIPMAEIQMSRKLLILCKNHNTKGLPNPFKRKIEELFENNSYFSSIIISGRICR